MFPYPSYPIFPKFRKYQSYLFNFETLKYLTTGTHHPHQQKKIALIGCGTFEPYAYSVAHPESEVWAIDLSEKSLEIAEQRIRHHNLPIRKIHFCCMKISQLTKLQQTFDYINCYGVLHHQEDPKSALLTLNKLLKTDGILRCMVYPSYPRRHITALHQLCQQHLGLSFEQPDALNRLQTFVDSLESDNPLKAAFYLYHQHPPEEMVDAFLHTYQKPLTMNELQSLVESTGFKLSQFLSPHLPSIPFTPPLVTAKKIHHLSDWEKINILENAGEIQSNIVFILNKQTDNKPIDSNVKYTLNESNVSLTNETLLFLNPALKPLISKLSWSPSFFDFFNIKIPDTLGKNKYLTLNKLIILILKNCSDGIKYSEIINQLKSQFDQKKVNMTVKKLIKSLYVYKLKAHSLK